jgi:hypothetical protein
MKLKPNDERVTRFADFENPLQTNDNEIEETI